MKVQRKAVAKQASGRTGSDPCSCSDALPTGALVHLVACIYPLPCLYFPRLLGGATPSPVGNSAFAKPCRRASPRGGAGLAVSQVAPGPRERYLEAHGRHQPHRRHRHHRDHGGARLPQGGGERSALPGAPQAHIPPPEAAPADARTRPAFPLGWGWAAQESAQRFQVAILSRFGRTGATDPSRSASIRRW